MIIYLLHRRCHPVQESPTELRSFLAAGPPHRMRGTLDVLLERAGTRKNKLNNLSLQISAAYRAIRTDFTASHFCSFYFTCTPIHAQLPIVNCFHPNCQSNRLISKLNVKTLSKSVTITD